MRAQLKVWSPRVLKSWGCLDMSLMSIDCCEETALQLDLSLGELLDLSRESGSEVLVHWHREQPHHSPSARGSAALSWPG